MGVFTESLVHSYEEPAEWHFVAYDQLNSELLPSHSIPEHLGLIFVETTWKPKQIPYHKQKLVLLLSNMRNFALEMQAKGHPVMYLQSESDYSTTLMPVAQEKGLITATYPAELQLRNDLENLGDHGLIHFIDHKGWLTTQAEFVEAIGDSPPWRMDRYYQKIRKNHGILLTDDGKPLGGKWSLDAENRLTWDRAVPLPNPINFVINEITREVIAMVNSEFSHHPGQIDESNLPTTGEDAQALWDWAKQEVMEYFGPYEDAMTSEHLTLFHTTISSLMNLHRLMPKQILDEALELDIRLNSKEGFVRQIIGWREFVRHVHDLTNGFEDLANSTNIQARPGAGWDINSSWADAKPSPNILGADYPLPPSFWGGETGMLCLDSAIKQVNETGYTHHVPRLMVLANIATLLGVNSREITDWFWAMFTDAYEWVVEPNVLAMGTYSVGEVMTTKPYVCGTPYIKKMGDYCNDCNLHFKKSCPISEMYWNFLNENKEKFEGNHRMMMPMRNLAKKTEIINQTNKNITEYVRKTLEKGRKIQHSELLRLKNSQNGKLFINPPNK